MSDSQPDQKPMRLTRYQDVEVVCDRNRSFGQPIVDRLGVPVSAIIERFVAGEDPEEIATDFDIGYGELFELLRVDLAYPNYREQCETVFELGATNG